MLWCFKHRTINNMKEYGQDDFMSMINDFLIDNAEEYEDDPLNLDKPKQDENGFWSCTAEDSTSTYILTDDGSGNIQINYIGTK